jgi:hypothetical protein
MKENKSYITKYIRTVLEQYYGFWVDAYKCRLEKRLQLKIGRDLYPPRWQQRRTEQKDCVHCRDKHQTTRIP